MRLVLVILLIFALPGKIYCEGIESESYDPDDDLQEEVARRPADAVVVVRGPARPGTSPSSPAPVDAARVESSSPSSAPTSTTSPPPAPETRNEEDDFLQFFDKKGKKRRHSYRSGEKFVYLFMLF